MGLHRVSLVALLLPCLFSVTVATVTPPDCITSFLACYDRTDWQACITPHVSADAILIYPGPQVLVPYAGLYRGPAEIAYFMQTITHYLGDGSFHQVGSYVVTGHSYVGEE
jgi:hypothetical protein